MNHNEASIEDSKTRELENYLKDTKKLKTLVEATCVQLDEISRECLGQSLPPEAYANWMNKWGFPPQEIDSAIRKTGGRRIEGGIEGLIKYVSGVLWRGREAKNGHAGKTAPTTPRYESDPF